MKLHARIHLHVKRRTEDALNPPTGTDAPVVTVGDRSTEYVIPHPDTVLVRAEVADELIGDLHKAGLAQLEIDGWKIGGAVIKIDPENLVGSDEAPYAILPVDLSESLRYAVS